MAKSKTKNKKQVIRVALIDISFCYSPSSERMIDRLRDYIRNRLDVIDMYGYALSESSKRRYYSQIEKASALILHVMKYGSVETTNLRFD